MLLMPPGRPSHLVDQLSGPLVATLLLMSPGRPSHRGSEESGAELHPLPPALQEEGSIQDLWGEEGYPHDGDGTPPGCDGGAEYLSTGRSAQDRDSPRLAAERECHHPRLHEDGRGSGQ
jgi:hypothetical protein